MESDNSFTFDSIRTCFLGASHVRVPGAVPGSGSGAVGEENRATICRERGVDEGLRPNTKQEAQKAGTASGVSNEQRGRDGVGWEGFFRSSSQRGPLRGGGVESQACTTGRDVLVFTHLSAPTSSRKTLKLRVVQRRPQAHMGLQSPLGEV